MTTTIEPPVKAKKKLTPTQALMRPDTSGHPLTGTEYNAGKPVPIQPRPTPEDMAQRLLSISSNPDSLLESAPDAGLSEMASYLAGMSDSQFRRGLKPCVMDGARYDMDAMGVLCTQRGKGFLTGLFRCLEVIHQRGFRLDPPRGVRGVGMANKGRDKQAKPR